MKAMAFVPAALAAILVLHSSSAVSQQACEKEYTACMSSCASKPGKSYQDTCFQGCQGKNDFCSERVYGKRPANGVPSNVVQQKAPAKETMAKTPAKETVAKDTAAKTPKGRDAAQASAKERVADDHAPQQAPQQQQQQMPARH